MGNQTPLGIPPMLANNWQPVPDHPNSFRNKLTFQYTHKHIINVEDPMQIQSFKIRMKQTNNYICRVLYYHQYHQCIYHVYTDEIHLTPSATKTSQWRSQKIKIVQSFAQLASIYGFFKVFKQMIGCDSNGHPKIWIHPDPVSAKPWSLCHSQFIMLSDILSIFSSLQQKNNQNKQNKQVNKTILPRTQSEYSTFSQYIKSQTLKLQRQQHQGKSKLNRTSTFLQNTTNININIKNNITNEDNHNNNNRNKNKNKSFIQNILNNNNMNMVSNPTLHNNNNNIHNVSSNSNMNMNGNTIINVNNYTNTHFLINQNKNINNNHNNINHNNIINNNIQDNYQQFHYNKQPRFSNVTQYSLENSNNMIKNNKLYKLFNTNDTNTTKDGNTKNKKMMYGDYSYSIQNKRHNNLSLERPTTHLAYNQNYSNKWLALNDLSRKEGQSFRAGQQPPKFNTNREEKSRSKLTNKTKQSTTNIDIKQDNNQRYKKSPLSKLITQTSQFSSHSHTNLQRRHQSTVGQNQQPPKFINNSLQSQNAFKSSRNPYNQLYINKKQQKYPNIPNFLMKSHTQLTQDIWESENYEKHPSTQRQNREMVQNKPPMILLKQQMDFLTSSRKQQDNSEDEMTRPRKNTVARLKQQLTNILQTPIQPDPQLVSHDFQNFKANKMNYKPPAFFQAYILDSQQDEKQEIDMIKQKVQEKRVRFAQLKQDARKILEDSL